MFGCVQRCFGVLLDVLLCCCVVFVLVCRLLFMLVQRCFDVRVCVSAMHTYVCGSGRVWVRSTWFRRVVGVMRCFVVCPVCRWFVLCSFNVGLACVCLGNAHVCVRVGSCMGAFGIFLCSFNGCFTRVNVSVYFLTCVV